jgi:GH35 family endo-1,4-beta-xylanase
MTARVLLLLALTLFAGAAHAVVTQDCALPGAACTIADAARQAHVHVGAITNRLQGPAERALLAEHFNATTPENEMKWGVIAPTVGGYDFADADAIAAFAADAGLRLRGHTLVWGRLQLPQDLTTLVASAPDPAARLRDLMTAHFETMLGRYGDRVGVWDVVNQPLDVFTGAYDPNIFYQTLGAGYVAEVFTLARALDPDAALFLNEFFLTLPGEKASALVTLVHDLRQAGVPIDGVGIQAHFFPGLPLVDPAAIESLVRSLADLGVAVELTEVDVSLWHFRNEPDPLAAQAAFYGRVAAACLRVPACRAITMWGLLDSETWLDTFPPFDAFAPNAPVLFDGSMTPKPAYFALRDVVAERAVPYAEQTAALRSTYDASVRAGTLAGATPGAAGRRQLRRGRRALGRAKRLLAKARFAAACAKLDRAAAVLATATGSAAPGLAETTATLRADLRCDEP